MGHIHTSVAAVLCLTDAMTERPVRYKGLQIQTAQQNKVVWKDTGCAVILGRDRAYGIDVLIAGKFCQEVRLHIEPESGAPPQVYTIWLQPSRFYPFQEDTAVIHGKCMADKPEELYVLWPADSTKYKLTETTTAGSDCISLWGISGSVEGRTFLFHEDSENGGREELVTLLGQAEQGKHMYRTKERIQQVYHRGKVKLYKAAKVSVDSSGGFFAALSSQSKGSAQTDGKVLFWSGGRTVAALHIGEEREYYIQIGASL